MTVSIGDIDPRHTRIVRQHGHVIVRIAEGAHLTFDTELAYEAFVRALDRDVIHQRARERAAHETAA